jgi:gp32 DNA binding protein like
MSLANLKKQQAALLEKLAENALNIDKPKNSTRQDDDRYWKPVVDKKTGTGNFKIRFLPALEGEENPFVHYFEYAFKWPATGKFYYGKSLTTINKPDPVADRKKEYRAAGREEDSKKMGRADRYVSNILVIDDPTTPENNGKVFLYKYGKQIFNKILAAYAGDEAAEIEKFNPFDPWNGKDFLIKVVTKSNMPNYENSTFLGKEKSMGSDAEIERIYALQYSLDAEVAEDQYEEYDVLKARLDRALGETPTSGSYTSSKPKAQKPKAEDEGDDSNVDPDDVDIGDVDIDDILKGV